MDQLTAHLASTSLVPSGQWTYFPPGTTLEEQLLILAGVQDYQLTGAADQTFNATELGDETIQDAMVQHLDMLQDSELANMLHTSLQINSGPAAPLTPPASP
ncbi:hypothetical protein CC86DRAFT_272216, partial [Ophiobolus disseminans]